MQPTHFHSWIWNESEFLPCSALPISDRGFRYGMAVFESLRFKNQHLYFQKEHWTRLQTACTQTGLHLPQTALEKIPAALAILNGEWFVRTVVTAGDGSPSSPITTPRVFLIAEPRARTTPDFFQILSSHTPYLAPFGGLKTANYWANVHAFSLALGCSAQETLLFHPNGELVSAAMANVFLHLDGKWITPPLKSGARNGVIRDWTLQHLPVQESRLLRDDLKRVESAFVTNSWIGIQPVDDLDNRPLKRCPLVDQLGQELISS